MSLLDDDKAFVALLLADAIAEDELRHMPRVRQVLNFDAMAARDTAFHLPEEPLPADNDDDIKALFEQDGSTVRVTLGAIGPATEALAGRWAVIRVAPRRVDYRFRFDRYGVASFDLDYAALTRDGQSLDFTVVVEDEKTDA